MYPDYTKLSTPVVCLMLACLSGTVAWTGEKLPEWVRLFLVLATIVLGTTGVVTMFDWMAYHAAERIRDIGSARVYPVQQVARALEGLSSSQVDAVMRFDRTEIRMMIGDETPMFTIRCLTRDVPWEFVQDYLKKSKESPGFLWPIRESGNQVYATEVTNLILARGWAEHGVGPFPARLVVPLETIAQRFGVEI